MKPRIATRLGGDRMDRSAHARRARAHSHLDRVRRGRGASKRARGSSRVTRFRAVALCAGALVAGAAFGEGVASRLTGMSDRRLEVIAVRGASHLAPNVVAGAAAVDPGASIGQLDPAVVATTLAEHDWIASAKALRLPTGTLVVEVVEREPAATVAIGDEIYAVDSAGRPFAVLTESPEPALPRILARDDVTPREAHPELAEAVRLASRLSELGLAVVAEIEVAREGDPEGYALRLATSDTRVVLGRHDLDARLERLARLLAARPDSVAGVAQIDVRFADQMVLRSEPTRDGSTPTAVGRGRDTSRSTRPAG